MAKFIAYKKNKNDKKLTVANVEKMHNFELFFAITDSAIMNIEDLTIQEAGQLLRNNPWLFEAYRLA